MSVLQFAGASVVSENFTSLAYKCSTVRTSMPSPFSVGFSQMKFRGLVVKVAGGVAPKVEALLDSVKWDDKGLAVAIAQDVDTGAILMQGFANKEALSTTILSQKATFFSRSRSSLWTKGETSNSYINVEAHVGQRV